MGLKNNPQERLDTTFASVLADGKIHVNVEEGTEGAVPRYYATEADKEEGKDKKSGVKHELIYTELSGVITKVDFHEGNYGTNLLLTVEDEDAGEDEKPVTLSLSTESNFGEDVMKKLPAIDLKKPVTFVPYSFEDKGKKKRGITITQLNKKTKEPEKITSFYQKDKDVINGYPKPPVFKKGAKVQKSVWRKYFGEVREFLVQDITERFDIKESQADKDFNAM